MEANQFFFIEVSHLKRRKIFGFKLFIHNPISLNTHLFLEANTPLLNDRAELMELLISKGGILCVLKKQQRSFLSSQNLSVYEVPSLAQMPSIADHEQLHVEINQEAPNKKAPLDQMIEKSFETGDFMPFIEAARMEISTFDQKTSHTQSLASHFARELLHEDNELNRIVALSFFLAKTIDIEDQPSLADLVCAAFLAHIGQTQAPLSNQSIAHLKMNAQQLKWHQRHGGFSQHLLRKSGVELSERCLKIIDQHHERLDGSGFPYQLKGDAIEPLALVLGAIDHLFDYHSGRVTGAPMPLAQVVSHIKNKNYLPGLEMDFGAAVLSGIEMFKFRS